MAKRPLSGALLFGVFLFYFAVQSLTVGLVLRVISLKGEYALWIIPTIVVTSSLLTYRAIRRNK